MYICLCKGVKESDVRQLALAGMVTAGNVVDAFGLDDEDCCGRCAKNVCELVALAASPAGCCSADGQPACPANGMQHLAASPDNPGHFRDSLSELTG